MLSNRQFNLVEYLLRQTKPVTGKELAELLSITDRTVRNDINAINNEYASSHYQIHATRNGYYILSPDKKWFQEQIKQESNNKVDTPATRFTRVIFLLLWLNTPITIDEIAECIYLSRSSTIKVLQQIKEYLGKSGNAILSYSHQGVQINGSEIEKRNLLIRFLMDSYNRGEIRNIKELLGELKLIKQEDFIWVYDTLIQYLNEDHLTFTDQELYLSTLELLLFIQRIESGFTIENEMLCNDLLKLPYSAFEQHFNCTISQQERAYFSLRIAGRNKVLQPVVNSKIVNDTIDAFIKELEETWGIRSDALAAYRTGLQQHLSSMIDRLSHHIEMDHTMVDEMRTQYPYAFECATAIIPLLKKNLGINVTDAEISYIAVYLAVILDQGEKKLETLVLCASGVGTGILLRKRLENHFGMQLNLHGPYPVYQLPFLLQENHADLIISTVPVTAETNIPVLQVSPMFTIDEQNHIINFLKMHSKNPQQKNGLFIQHDLFYQFDGSDSRDEMLRVMAKGLQQKGMIENAENFVASIKERENLYSTVYGKIWLPHPINAIALNNGIAAATVKNDSELSLIFMLAIPRDNTAAFSDFYQKIMILMDKPQWVDKLCNSTDFGSFLNIYSSLQ